jgi:hypothetical protein
VAVLIEVSYVVLYVVLSMATVYKYPSACLLYDDDDDGGASICSGLGTVPYSLACIHSRIWGGETANVIVKWAKKRALKFAVYTGYDADRNLGCLNEYSPMKRRCQV